MVGIGTQVINQAFENAIKKAPSILFIDEADSVAPQREYLGTSGYELDVKTQISALLTRLNNLGQKKVLVVFATNEPQNIDKAIKRTGRLDKKSLTPKIFCNGNNRCRPRCLFLCSELRT